MAYELTELTGGIPAILSPMLNTPRTALAVAMGGGASREGLSGTAKLAGRLLQKGTERRNADELARELDERAIDIREVVLADCLVVVAIFLTREFDAALELLEDMLFHSTFTDFAKEKDKLIGETQAALDHPSEMAHDLLNRTLFAGHPYGHTGTRVLEEVDNLNADAVRRWYYDGLMPGRMNVTLVGNIAPQAVVSHLSDIFGNVPAREPATPTPAPERVEGDRVVTKARANAQQAQVYRGWYAPPLGADIQPAMAVMNTILGAGGLSSRLFVELRDKQGLAYSVRSQYIPMRQCGEFLVSIGTSPENIAKARQGFADQIARLQNEPITQDELDFARGRLHGVYVLGHETASQRCMDMAISHINGMPPDYGEQFLTRIDQVTIPEVQAAAQTITAPSVTAIVAREDALPASE